MSPLTVSPLTVSPDWWGQLFDFQDYGQLLVLLQNSILAGAVLGGLFLVAAEAGRARR